jgi:hypothetical protein
MTCVWYRVKYSSCCEGRLLRFVFCHARVQWEHELSTSFEMVNVTEILLSRTSLQSFTTNCGFHTSVFQVILVTMAPPKRGPICCCPWDPYFTTSCDTGPVGQWDIAEACSWWIFGQRRCWECAIQPATTFLWFVANDKESPRGHELCWSPPWVMKSLTRKISIVLNKTTTHN